MARVTGLTAPPSPSRGAYRLPQSIMPTGKKMYECEAWTQAKSSSSELLPKQGPYPEVMPQQFQDRVS